MLNFIWSGFFIVSFVIGLYQTFFGTNGQIFSQMLKSSFEMSKLGFEISLGLTGVMAFWLGMMKIGEKAGLVQKLGEIFYPILTKFFPTIPKNHPAISSILLNLSANFLGIDNAATPFGLKAMQELQELNPDKQTASDAQIMFLVINTSAVTLIPVTIFTYLYELGFQNPAEVFFPILMATFCSTLAGVSLTCFIQKIPLVRSGILFILLFCGALIASLFMFLRQLTPEALGSYSMSISSMLIFATIVFFISLGLIKKVNVYDAFIEGAKDGFQVAIGIIPYLIAMLVGIGLFRTSGALDFVVNLIALFFSLFSTKESFDFIDALPTAFMKPLSGSGARAMMVDTIKENGPNHIVSKMVATIQGSTETTFYVLAVYFGSVKIRFTRYAAAAGLFADLVGVIVAILSCYVFFPNL